MNFTHLIKNATNTTVDAIDRLADDGHDVLVVAAKLSLRFDTTGALRLTARPLRQAAESEADGSIRFPQDFPLERPGTDVFLVGTCLPDRIAASNRIVSFGVGAIKKSIRVFGPRVWTKTALGIRPGPAANIVPTPLTFAHVFGGRDGDTYEPRNPVGRGFATKPENLLGKETQRLEPFNADDTVLTSACFAPIDCGWEPRRSFMGTYDAQWSAHRSPIAPKDRDARFHSDALPEQRSLSRFKLPLDVNIAGLYGNTSFRFLLPEYAVHVTFDDLGDTTVHAQLVRVLVDGDARIVELLYVAQRRLPRKWEAVGGIRITSPNSLPDEIKYHTGSFNDGDPRQSQVGAS